MNDSNTRYGVTMSNSSPATSIKPMSEEEQIIFEKKQIFLHAMNDFSKSLLLSESTLTYDDITHELDQVVLDHIMPQVNYNQSHAAQKLGINRGRYGKN